MSCTLSEEDDSLDSSCSCSSQDTIEEEEAFCYVNLASWYCPYADISCQCEEKWGGIGAVLCLKLFLIIFTFLAGGILALTINVWMKRTIYSAHNDTEPPGDKFGDGITFFQIENPRTGLCVDDNNLTDKWDFSTWAESENVEPAIQVFVQKCNRSGRALSQYFKYDRNKGFLFKDKYCIEVIAIIDMSGQSELPLWMKRCKENRRGQIWMPDKGKLVVFNQRGVKLCLSVEKSKPGNQPLKAAECTTEEPNHSDQIWIHHEQRTLMVLSLYSREYVKSYVLKDPGGIERSKEL